MTASGEREERRIRMQISAQRGQHPGNDIDFLDKRAANHPTRGHRDFGDGTERGARGGGGLGGWMEERVGEVFSQVLGGATRLIVII